MAVKLSLGYSLSSETKQRITWKSMIMNEKIRVPDAMFSL